MVSGGIHPDDAVPQGLIGPGYTYLMPGRSLVDANGTVTSFAIKCGSFGGYAKIKVFRINGLNYDFVGESALVNIPANSTYWGTLSLAVLTGDILGIYAQDSIISGWGTGTYSHIKSHSGDVSTNTPIADWELGGDDSIAVYVTDTIQNIYVNSSTGNDANAGDSCVAGHPKLTFAAAYAALTSGGTIHVCNTGADFSAETVTLNKSFSIDLNGASGYWYGPKGS